MWVPVVLSLREWFIQPDACSLVLVYKNAQKNLFLGRKYAKQKQSTAGHIDL